VTTGLETCLDDTCILEHSFAYLYYLELVVNFSAQVAKAVYFLQYWCLWKFCEEKAWEAVVPFK